MKRLLTFENFLPKNIDQRAKDLEKIQQKELEDYQKFMVEFQTNLDKLQGLTSTSLQEKLFLQLLQGLTLKQDQTKYPFIIYLFNNKGQYLFEYDWKNNIFWCHYDRVWLIFISKMKIEYSDWQQLIANMVEKYFKFRPDTTTKVIVNNVFTVEKYFKFRPDTTETLWANYNL